LLVYFLYPSKEIRILENSISLLYLYSDWRLLLSQCEISWYYFWVCECPTWPRHISFCHTDREEQNSRPRTSCEPLGPSQTFHHRVIGNVKYGCRVFQKRRYNSYAFQRWQGCVATGSEQITTWSRGHPSHRSWSTVRKTTTMKKQDCKPPRTS
jgi:hypothetical protein